ncbi:hypothetical protein HPP92_005322 [Vanilla planifolia]|uniref:Beta-fructofuranosidase n=1 Tax=Vanilla planifolia TaxID=51239 RepID=A0A835RMP6_VANPL|nr:hypothetical protein HPP92_005322 [Vanilla planifolia]
MADATSYALLPTSVRTTTESSGDSSLPASGGFFFLSFAVVLITAVAFALGGGFVKDAASHVVGAISETDLDGELQNLHSLHPDPVSRGPVLGVSEKASGGSASLLLGGHGGYPWTNDMLHWQRTGFHFQPPRNWMNDPNGPVFYKGWYHLFYQYNRDAAVWGNITWGHAASRDLVHWLHLPVAMVPDQWYDANGVWTGSATVLPDGGLVMVYTGSANSTVQVQCVAVPADPNDALLLHWRKHPSNPVLLPPPSVLPHDFRDPTTAWVDPSDPSAYLLAIGSKNDTGDRHAGVAYVYSTRDFLSYRLLPGALHTVNGTGMWECVDFFPVSVDGARIGLDTSERAGDGVKHVLKASLDDDRHDYYAIGTYVAEENRWVPDDGEMDVGVGLRYDWGKFYAAKTFYDQNKKRRVLWGWVGEADSERADVSKGWASLMSIPRTVGFDTKTGRNLVFWPVEEVEFLRTTRYDFSGVTVEPGSIVPLSMPTAAQVDIEAQFELDSAAVDAAVDAEIGYNCRTSDGAAGRGLLGPFGLLVLADSVLSERTAAYFYVSRSADGTLRTHFCQDETRSSHASDTVKRVVGYTVPVLDGETLSVRILVDHSIVESFAQGGRSAITSRVYPTQAFNRAKVFLFNNATSAHVKAKSLRIWEMDSTFNHYYRQEAVQICSN